MELDNVDQAILHLLQVDARNNTNTEIGTEVGVAASTVSNRIREMEGRDLINGYHPAIDYRRAGLPFHTLFVCTAPVAEREEITERALDAHGVVDVWETIAGERNVFVEAVSRSVDELQGVTKSLDGLGLTIHSSEMLLRHRSRPFDQFGTDLFDE